jgi:glycosyltransferase involved in cell wall biosynthesis
MKVLLVAPAPRPGGPVGGMGSVTENILHYFKSNSHEIDLIYYNTVHHIRSLMSRSFGIRLITGIINSLATYFRVLIMIKNNKPDVIHLASSSSFALIKDFLLVRAANKFRIPVVMHWHFGRAPSLALKQNWEWKIFSSVVRRSTMSIVIDMKSYSTLQKERLSNVVYVPNPLALDVVQKANELSLKMPNHRQKNRLIYAGHVIRNKGVFELVEACSQIPVDIELMLIGSYKEKIKKDLAEIAHLKDEGRWLTFAGQQKKDQVLEFMYNSPILVLPSYTEGFPMVIIEAMAMGCAIIATDVGAIPEILAVNTDTPCGICIPPQNTEKLKNAISVLVKDPLMVDQLGKSGTERVLNNYSPGKVINEYVKIWQTTVS